MLQEQKVLVAQILESTNKFATFLLSFPYFRSVYAIFSITEITFVCQGRSDFLLFIRLNYGRLKVV